MSAMLEFFTLTYILWSGEPEIDLSNSKLGLIWCSLALLIALAVWVAIIYGAFLVAWYLILAGYHFITNVPHI